MGVNQVFHMQSFLSNGHASIGKVNEVQNDMGNDEDIYVDEYD